MAVKSVAACRTGFDLAPARPSDTAGFGGEDIRLHRTNPTLLTDWLRLTRGWRSSTGSARSPSGRGLGELLQGLPDAPRIAA